MSIQRRFFCCAYVIIIVVCLTTSVSFAKSVFVVNHEVDSISAYNVNNGQVEYRENLSLPTNGYGPVDVTLDSVSGILLVTNEEGKYGGGGNVIELVSAKRLLPVGSITLTHEGAPDDIAGIVVDNNDLNQPKVYLIDRNTNNLFTYLWDPDELTLTLETPDPSDPNDPDYVPNPKSLDNITTGFYPCGIDLDETNGILYVSEFLYIIPFEYSSKVHTYDRDDDWEYLQTYELDENIVGIAYDSTNENIYGGAYGGHDYLMQYNINEGSQDPNNAVNIGTSVTAVDVDELTEYVYITTVSGEVRGLKRYDFIDYWDKGEYGKTSEGLSGAAGITFAENGYVDAFIFTLEKDDDSNGCVPAGDGIEYTIKYEYQWTDDDDPLPGTNVILVDKLPREVDFISASDSGEYDSDAHTVTWIFDPNFFDGEETVTINTKVNKRPTPGQYITNSCSITANFEGIKRTISDSLETEICSCSESGNIIYVDITQPDPNDGSSWEEAFDDLRDGLDIAYPCDEIWVADGTYQADNSTDPFIELVNYVGVYGGFNGDETKRYERYWVDYETILCGDVNNDDDYTKAVNDPDRNNEDNVDYVVIADGSVRYTVLDGFTIRNGYFAGIYASNRLSVIEHNLIEDNGEGVYLYNARYPIVKNNFIYDNIIGVNIIDPVDPNESITIRNNTIVDNIETGIYFDGLYEPSVSNCIMWDNNDANDIVGCIADYSCMEFPPMVPDPSDPNDMIMAGIGNIDDNPSLDIYYRLQSTSPCIDAGNDPNNTFYVERDIDKEFRVLDGNADDSDIIDMGADEYCDEGESKDADFNNDKIVNYLDFVTLADAWLTSMDIVNLQEFANEWLWVSCSKMADIPMTEAMMAMGGGGSMMSMPMSIDAMSAQAFAVEPTIEERIEQVERGLDFLNEVLEDEEVIESIDLDNLQKVIDSLEDMFEELENSL